MSSLICLLWAFIETYRQENFLNWTLSVLYVSKQCIHCNCHWYRIIQLYVTLKQKTVKESFPKAYYINYETHSCSFPVTRPVNKIISAHDLCYFGVFLAVGIFVVTGLLVVWSCCSFYSEKPISQFINCVENVSMSVWKFINISVAIVYTETVNFQLSFAPSSKAMFSRFMVLGKTP